MAIRSAMQRPHKQRPGHGRGHKCRDGSLVWPVINARTVEGQLSGRPDKDRIRPQAVLRDALGNLGRMNLRTAGLGRLVATDRGLDPANTRRLRRTAMGWSMEDVLLLHEALAGCAVIGHPEEEQGRSARRSSCCAHDSAATRRW